MPYKANPTQSMIDEYHAKYMEALTHLFDTHKEKYIGTSHAHITFI